MLGMKILALTGLVVLAAVSSAPGADGPVEQLQESYGAGPAGRRTIYTQVISQVRALGAGADSVSRLAEAVALGQRAMDEEDALIERLIQVAPNFSRISVEAPSFLNGYREAAAIFESLAPGMPWLAPYAEQARLVAGRWTDGPGLLEEALLFRLRYPASRFWKRHLLLAAGRLLLERDYPRARRALETLWEADPAGIQALTAYRLAAAMRMPDRLGLSADRMLAWGRAEGWRGNAILLRLIERHRGSEAAQLAYVRLFEIVNQSFVIRTLSDNFKKSDQLERYYAEFRRDYPDSPHLQALLIEKAQFNYRCGKKAQAIARKNEYSWTNHRVSSRRQTARQFSDHAAHYFERTLEADSAAMRLFPRTRCDWQTGIYTVLSLMEGDDFDAALARLELIRGEQPDSGSLTQACWYSGLIHYLRGDFARAEQVLAPLEESWHRDREYWARAMLFLGKTRLAQGDRAAADRALGLLAGMYPYSYHGIRARALRAELRPEGPRTWPDEQPVEPLPQFPRRGTPLGELVRQEAAQWEGLGFHAEAAYSYSAGLEMAPEDYLLRFRSHENLLRAGWFQRVLRGFLGPFDLFLRRGGQDLPDNFWRVAYLFPEPFKEIIEEQGRAAGIPPALVTAVMRQESSFHPRARSYVGAVGLMQLLPSVGRRLARSAGLGAVNEQQLYRPEINIRLGVRFLGNSLSRYDGNIALTLSSYNADPRNLAPWLERSRLNHHSEGFDLDLFVELIPLEETHDYNIRVLTNFWRYQEVYGERRELFGWRIPGFLGS